MMNIFVNMLFLLMVKENLIKQPIGKFYFIFYLYLTKEKDTLYTIILKYQPLTYSIFCIITYTYNYDNNLFLNLIK